MVSEPAVGYSAKMAVPVVEFKYPDGYDGFYTEDSAEFEAYKSKLIAEAMNDGIGCTWNEVRQQIRQSGTGTCFTGRNNSAELLP